jgi:hypothetical protein
LRVPGSLNFKRADQFAVPLGHVVMFSDLVHPAGTMEKVLPLAPMVQRRAADDHPEPIHVAQRVELMAHYWEDLTLRGRSMLSSTRVKDRSLHIVKTVHELLNGGLEPEATFHLVWVQPWCKWRTDRNDPERLWEEVMLAQA